MRKAQETITTIVTLVIFAVIVATVIAFTYGIYKVISTRGWTVGAVYVVIGIPFMAIVVSIGEFMIKSINVRAFYVVYEMGSGERFAALTRHNLDTSEGIYSLISELKYLHEIKAEDNVDITVVVTFFQKLRTIWRSSQDHNTKLIKKLGL